MQKNTVPDLNTYLYIQKSINYIRAHKLLIQVKGFLEEIQQKKTNAETACKNGLFIFS